MWRSGGSLAGAGSVAAGFLEEVILTARSETAGCGELEAALLLEGPGNWAGREAGPWDLDRSLWGGGEGFERGR